MTNPAPIPTGSMAASVYRGGQSVRYEQIPVPAIGPGELLIQVQACGICHTDLKKIEHDLLPPPRVYGHETAGIVAEVGPGVSQYQLGDRVTVFHHIPCQECFYCRHGNYAQCATYKRVGVTAGFEPAGGGFAQYVRVMDWVARRGVERVPDGVSFERACFVEPVNTCLKALDACPIAEDEVALILGQGPIGLLFLMLLRQQSAGRVFTTDPLANRLEKSSRLGATESWNAGEVDIVAKAKNATDGRGADVVLIAASAPGIVEQAVAASRPGARILLFAQTSAKEQFTLDGASICAGERTVFGSYSASIDLQKKSAEMVWRKDFPVEELISHQLPLAEMERGIELARSPRNGSLKVIMHPQR